ncbi:hypothetical protein P170DRAFT_437818 [Aspergillus steynii IBT 23096]|uniref:Uncharacterized protein n=1 Tax=Aspergillus steynii IBT 23096 TaxID=1392250 RepID=A0A2I2G5F3_9EURO|nr:uncharacterized protein P170DRAFT_437818 [Aspergillus steynii IBT 23096]PLB48109.1 hypothetical protein P170DRAFT_437818 [Aspergillus steynii IBT 23096]
MFFLRSGFYGSIACLALQVSAAGNDRPSTRAGYGYGQPMPVTCLNRTIDSGEHITDDLGKLQYIPFPVCNETSLPLALRYGVPETVNCTVNSLPDELYHLLEYYVHSDVPMTCRIPTGPLSPAAASYASTEDGETVGTELGSLAEDGPAYTPITFALQGTLQRSHLHIWTDMNVLLHNIASTDRPKNKKKKKAAQQSPGYAVAGTAYSVPEFDVALLKGEKTTDDDSSDDDQTQAAAVAENAREPWTAGHGTKVIRGEPLTFTFHVNWIEGGAGIGWPSRGTASSAGESGASGFFSKLFFFVLAASVGALVALYWERNGARRRAGWRGDGILGVPSRGKGSIGITYGNGGKMNGYGGYASASSSSTSGGGGYGGFMAGKRD